MPDIIMVLSDRPVSTGSLFPALKRSFPHCAIKGLSTADFHAGALGHPSVKMLVMPGVYGETSPYPSTIGEEGLKRIHDFAARGGVVFAICAASYFIFKDTLYHPPWGESKTHRSLNHLFNGAARGPVGPYGRKPDSDPKFGDVIVIPVRYKTIDGQWHDAHACYANGPALYLHDANDPDIEIFAVFSGVPGQPAAMARRGVGKGAIYPSGILPEINYQFVHPHASLAQASRLMRELKPHEANNLALWQNLAERMNMDMGYDLGLATSPSPSPRTGYGIETGMKL